MIHPDKLFGQLGNRMFQMAYIYAQSRKGKINDIYVQDPIYFDEYAKEIRAWFGQGVGKRIPQIAVHVRRGDYVGNKFYVDLAETQYYYLAMAEFGDVEFLVFSDDIEWCKKQEIFNGCSFAEGNDSITDMNLMAACEGHIIANSSFSWWAAYLSPYTKKVVCPNIKESWYADKVVRTFVPSSWIQITG